MAVITTLQDSNIDNVANLFMGIAATSVGRYSRNGTIWTASAPAALLWYSLAFGNDIAVAVETTANTTTANSTIDGFTFIARTITAAGAGRGYYATGFGNLSGGIFVALTGGTTTGTVAASSTDGITWTSRTQQTGDWRCVAFNGSRFLSVSYGGTASQYSTNGTTWSAGGSLPIAANWISIAYDASINKFVAISNGPLVVNYVNATTLAFTSGTKTITRAAGNFTTDGFVVGTTFTVTGSVSNNTSFTVATVSTTTLTVSEAVTTEGASATTVMTPTSYNAAYSTDGTSWSGAYMSSYSNWRSVAASGSGKFVAVSSTSDTKAAVSTNGTSWSASTLPVAAVWNNVCYGNGIFIASSSGSTNSAVSTDGTTWALWAQVNSTWTSVIWAPFTWRSNDTLTIQNSNVITVNTTQKRYWSAITVNNGILRITNTSTSSAIRFITGRSSGAVAGTITLNSGLGSIEVTGNWITLSGTGDGTSNQAFTVPYTDYVPCLWVEKTAGGGDWEIWLNVSGAYGGSLKSYADGISDVSTGSRGKFFTQTPAATQDVVISLSNSTTVIGSRLVTVSSLTGIFTGASISGTGIPANSVVEDIIVGTSQLLINRAATGAASNTTVTIYNPAVSQFTNQVVFGDGVHGNKLAVGAHVKIPNIMITNDTAANVMTASAVIGTSIVTSAGGGGRATLNTCLFDDAYHNFTQFQSVAITDVGINYPPTITKIYDFRITGLGIGITPVRRFYSTLWTNRDVRNTLGTTSAGVLTMSYISSSTLSNIAIVSQSPNAITAGTLNAPVSMINLSYSDYVTMSNIRLFSLNTTRTYQVGLALMASVTNSTFSDLEYYGGPMLNLQLSQRNTFTRLTNSESMFSYVNFYNAGHKVTYDPNTGANMVDSTKYYFKARTFFTRDRVQYTESRVYSGTPFLGSTYFPDYFTAYCSGTSAIAFGWTHRVPMYTGEWGKCMVELHRSTSPGFTIAPSTRAAGINVAPSVYIPTIVLWATNACTLTFNSGKTITRSSGSFITDGFTVGDKVTALGTTDCLNNTTFTITDVATSVLTVSEAMVTQSTYTQNVRLIAKDIPALQIQLTSLDARTLKFDSLNITAVPVTRTFSFTGSKTITCSSGSWLTDGFAVGDKIMVSGTTSNNTAPDFLTINTVVAATITVNETLVVETASTTANLKVQKLTASSGSFITDGYAVGDIITFAGSTSALNDKTFTVLGVTATILNFIENVVTQTAYNTASSLTLYNRKIANAKVVTANATKGRTLQFQHLAVTASSTRILTFSVLKTITATGAAPGNFTSDGWVVGDKIIVTGTTLNNSTFTLTAVAATVLTVSEMMFDETSYTANATLTTNKLVASTGSFVTDPWIIGDRMIVSGTTSGLNDGTFTVTNVVALTINLAETVTTQAAYSSTINILAVKQLPHRVAYATAARTLTISATTMTFSSGSLTQDGYIVGDCVKVNGTSFNNRVFNIPTLSATVITPTEVPIAETIATNTITWNHTGNKPTMTAAAGRTLTWSSAASTITASTGSFVTDNYLVGDRLFVTGTTANNGWYTLTNVATLALTVSEPIITDVTAYAATATITAYHPAQKVTITAAGGRTLTFNVAKSITASSGSFILDGYVAGDAIVISGTTSGLNDGYFTISAVVSATVIYVNEPLYTQATYSATATLTPFNVANGTTYYYKLRKYDDTGVYHDSAEVEVTPTEQQLGMNLALQSTTLITSWTAVSVTVGAATRVSPYVSHAATQTADAKIFTATGTPGTLTQSVPTATGQQYTFSVYHCSNPTAADPTVTGKITLGTATTSFTSTALWQVATVTFTATTTTTSAILTIDTNGKSIIFMGATITKGATADPNLTTTTVPIINANKVRDISLVRAWCRAYGNEPTHSGIELALNAAVTGELWSEVYCGTTAGFTPDLSNCILTTWQGSGNTLHFNNVSADNTIDTFTQLGKGAPASYVLAYFALSSSRNIIKDLTYDLGGAYMAGLASFNTQSNDTYFNNWSINNFRNYNTTSTLYVQAANTFSGVTTQNLIMNNSDSPLVNIGQNMIFKGVSGGNATPANSALTTALPQAPVWSLGSTTDGVAIAYAGVYDTIFHELYFSSTTGCLHLAMNASSKASKPYVLTGTAYFDNTGKLFLQTAGDSATFEWPHKILGVTSFRNLAFKLSGLDLGNSTDLLEGVKIEYAIKTTGSYSSFALATPATLSSLTLPDPTVGFNFKLKLTAMPGMKYNAQVKNFVASETIQGIVSGATAVVDTDFDMSTQGTLWLTSISGTFFPGEAIVRHSDGEMRATNVATNTSWALFPSYTSYINGLQIYTNVDQTAKYPETVVTITLANIIPDSVYYIFNSNTSAQIATGTATGTPGPGESTIDYSFSIVYTADTNITVRVRKSTSPTKYLPYEIGGTITSSGALIFIAQVFDSVVLDSYGSISGDWTVNDTIKTIRHTAGSTIYTVKQLYSWLLDYFDNAGYLADAMPMSASTPTEYSLINGWFIDDASLEYLSGGAITSIGQNTTVYKLSFNSALYTSALTGDLGLVVHNAGSTATGSLLDFDNARKVWWVRKTTGTFANSDVITITSGTGAGTIASSAGVATGESVWSNIFTLGSLVSGTTLDIYQNDLQLTPWWSTGHIDILVKVTESGNVIDSGYLTILARQYTTLYDHFRIDASSGRNPVPLAAFTDGNNQTSSGTVAAYSGFTFSFGAASKDMGNGSGARPYDVVINCNNHSLQHIYEYLKYVTRTGSSTTLNGVNGEYYTAVGDIRFAYDTEASGPFAEGEQINGTGNVYGYLVSLIDSGTTGTMVLRSTHGTFVDNMTLTGVTSGATALVNGGVTAISPQKQAPFGTLAGSRFFGAQGVWLDNVASADTNNYQLIDSTGTLQTPATGIVIKVTGLVSGDRVSMFRTTGDNEVVDKSIYTSHATSNLTGNTSFVVQGSISVDTPTLGGTLRVVHRSSAGAILSEQTYTYLSWTGSTFTLSDALSMDYTADDTAFVPYIDTEATSASTQVAVTYPGSDRNVVTSVRKKGIIPFTVKGVVESSGLTVTAIRTTDTIAQ